MPNRNIGYAIVKKIKIGTLTKNKSEEVKAQEWLIQYDGEIRHSVKTLKVDIDSEINKQNEVKN